MAPDIGRRPKRPVERGARARLNLRAGYVYGGQVNIVEVDCHTNTASFRPMLRPCFRAAIL
jgi:hypothetical protein